MSGLHQLLERAIQQRKLLGAEWAGLVARGMSRQRQLVQRLVGLSEPIGGHPGQEVQGRALRFAQVGVFTAQLHEPRVRILVTCVTI